MSDSVNTVLDPIHLRIVENIVRLKNKSGCIMVINIRIEGKRSSGRGDARYAHLFVCRILINGIDRACGKNEYNRKRDKNVSHIYL